MRSGILLIVILMVAGVQPAHGQTFREYLVRADSLYNEGEHEASAQSYEKAFELEQAGATNYYNAACSWSLAGVPDKAFKNLEMALERGFKDLDLLLTDTDLAPLHGDPRWDSIATRCGEALDAYLETINTELYEMFQEDQSDRQGDIDWTVVSERDEARRLRAQEMLESGLLKTADDFVHAAFIFQHGPDSTSYRTAHEMAMKAVELDSTYTRARWIAAASKDRYLQSVGLPQIYGTQYRQVDGTWTQEPFDTTAVSDAERAKAGVRTLAEQRARLAEWN